MELIVGIDVDGVLVDTNYIDIIARKEYGETLHPEEYYVNKRYGLPKEEVDIFWNTYRMDYIQNAPIVSGIEKFGRYLTMNEIPHYVITNRGLGLSNYAEKKLICNKTDEIVRKYFPNVKDIVYNEIETKLPECLRNGINVMIEDCVDNVKDLSEYMYCILIERDYNINFKHPKVVHAKDLSEVPEILEIIRSML